jgi:hypothetical protein
MAGDHNDHNGVEHPADFYEGIEEDPGEDPGEDTEPGFDVEVSPGVPADEAPSDPIPVELTDETYADFRELHGPEQAALLESAWKDQAATNEIVVNSFIDDHPNLDAIIAKHEGDGTGLSLEGVSAVGDYLQSAGFNLAELGDLENIVLENFDNRTGGLTAAGVWIALNYIGQRVGYKVSYRNSRR